MSFSSYKQKIAEHLDSSPDDVFLYWKGRVGFYALLKALNIGPGDEVIIPGFTCVVVSNAILYTGAIPVYADIKSSNLTIDPAEVQKLITEKTKIILAQNTFGVSSDIKALQNLAGDKIHVLEDCTHGFGGSYQGQPNGKHCDAAFFSTQWNKPFTTGIGGFVVSNSKALSERLKTINESLKSPNAKEVQLLKAQWQTRHKLGNKVLGPGLKLYRWMTKRNLMPGSSGGGELESIKQPKNYFKGMSEFQAKKGSEKLNQFQVNVAHRKRIAKIYKQLFDDLNFDMFELGDLPLVIPVLSNRRAFIKKDMMDQRLPVSDWFYSPIHPVVRSVSKWKYKIGSCPIGEFASKHMISLYTDEHVSEKQAMRTAGYLYDQRAMLINPASLYENAIPSVTS